MSEWKEYRFSDIAKLAGVSVAPEDAVKYPYIGLEHMKEGGFSLEGIGNAVDVISGKTLFREGDILFGKLRPYFRKVYKARFDGICSTDIWVIEAKNGFDQSFLFYLVANQRFVDILSKAASGTKMPRASWSYASKLMFRVPEPSEQRAIAGVLSSLDDKIELLRKQNETLEAMASALFKHWFVDGAKETWDTGTLNSILSVKGGTTPSTVNSEYWNGIIHWTTPKDLSNNPYIFLFDTERTISKQGLDQISSGLLPVGTILLSSRAPVGYLAITDIPVAVNQGYIAIIDNKGYSKYFLYLWLKLNMRYIKANANGSTFREISKSVFKSLESIKPPKQLRLEFDRIVEPLFQKIRTNSKRIDTLTRLRDLLLLKLMSGEIRVEDINSNGKGNK